MLAHGNSGLAERRTAAGEAARERRCGALRRGAARNFAAYRHPRALGARSGAGCTQELSFIAQADRFGPAAILRGTGVGARSLCGIASVGRDRQEAAVGDFARRPVALEPAGHPGFSERSLTRFGARSVLLS